jgi:hypothetical protein
VLADGRGAAARGQRAVELGGVLRRLRAAGAELGHQQLVRGDQVGDEVLHGQVVDHLFPPLDRGEAFEQGIEALHPGGVAGAGLPAAGRPAGRGRGKDGVAQPRRR